MSDGNDKSTAALAGGSVIFGMIMGSAISESMRDQPLVLRIIASAIAGGVLAALFVLVANRFRRK